MPHKDPDVAREYRRAWRRRNRWRVASYQRKRRAKYRERERARSREYEKRPHVRAFRKRYRDTHRRQARARQRKFRATPKRRSYARDWHQKNAKRLRPSKTAAMRKWRNEHAADPQFRIACRLRSRIGWVRLKLAIRGGAEHRLDLLGCYLGDFMTYLEQQFQPGMSWENMGEWHIDHMRPLASFDLTDPAQQRAAFHFRNLQPLWARDNLSKGARWQAIAAPR